jgi:cyclopropane fatty-acyl-phospholipid synthase-like methyltransferase
VDPTSKPPVANAGGQYDANYSNFQTELYEQIRREAFGEDIGQHSWLTAGEQDKFVGWLDLAPGKTLLDVACGAGGPALRIAAITGCSIVGVDVHETAVSNARRLATARDLSSRAAFQTADASRVLPFPDATFDAILCVDAINHLPDRSHVITDWARLLKPTGKILFTDPVIVTGPLTNSEVAARSSTGFYLLVPPGYDEQIIAASGLHLRVAENVTQNMADIAERRGAARAAHQQALSEVEGRQVYDRQQEFLATVARAAREGRLSRFAYVAEKMS